MQPLADTILIYVAFLLMTYLFWHASIACRQFILHVTRMLYIIHFILIFMCHVSCQ